VRVQSILGVDGHVYHQINTDHRRVTLYLELWQDMADAKAESTAGLRVQEGERV
jgi:hypothetical protein